MPRSAQMAGNQCIMCIIEGAFNWHYGSGSAAPSFSHHSLPPRAGRRYNGENRDLKDKYRIYIGTNIRFRDTR